MNKYILVDENIVLDLVNNQNIILGLLQQKRNKTNDSSLLTVSQSAKYLNISEVFLRKLIDNRELNIKRMGRAIRIEKEELDKLGK